MKAYSADELKQAAEKSPAVARYLANPRNSSLTSLRQQAWLTASIDTLLQKQSARQITLEWSHAADRLLQEAWRSAKMDSLPATLLALGKLGAEELNLSSDVDLVIVAQASATAEVSRHLKDFMAKLFDSEIGLSLLRVDFDLRPGGRFGPLIPTPAQVIDYYWNHGETWERLAWVRARKVCGDESLANEILHAMNGFCYRRYLDFSVIEDLKLLRHRIHSSISIPDNEIHLKLSVGGIRDIELFVHSLLIIHGGRRPEIRSHSTSEALRLLNANGLLTSADIDFLDQAYWRLRHFENLIQSYEDRQDHILVLGPSHPLISTPEQQECIALCKSVDTFVSTLLGPIHNQTQTWPASSEAQIKWLTDKGFSASVVEMVWPQLESATALSLKTERDEILRRQFLSRFVTALEETHLDQDLGLETLLEFVRSVRAKASFFSMLLREPRLIRDLSHLFSVSPYLGKLVSSRPELLDSFLIQKTGPPSAEWDLYLEELAERRQLGELMAAALFLNSMDNDRFGADLSATADEICMDLLKRLKQEFKPSSAEIVALGKWGGAELGIRSDLDFMVVTEGEPTEDDHRLVRRFISRLTEVHRGGRIYSVDLRLRPSGQAGPLLVSRQKLLEFAGSSAQAWQRQSYLRARSLSNRTLDLRPQILSRKITADEIEKLKEIRTKLIRVAPMEEIDLKYSSGGLLATEFAAQTTLLRQQDVESPPDTLGMIHRLMATDAAWQKAGKQIINDYQHLRCLEQLNQLTSLHSGSVLVCNSPQFQRLALIFKTTPSDLALNIRQRQDRLANSLTVLDPLNADR